MIRTTVERATRLGRIRGFERMGVETWRGIRYAEPPQRFRASVLASTPWQGVYDATRFKALAMQPALVPDVYGSVPDAPYDEDCLFLDIHAPQAVAAPRPVIVFIHGGSFTGGSAHCYDGNALARGADAVVVCINYRLGVFAALDLDWLGGPRDGQGQLWLGDQINALRWVRDNIADYGGDPQLVTIIGESAGAVSVAALCAAPQAAGLVHRAVACSTGYMVDEASNDLIGIIARARRCSRDQALVWLQQAPASELVRLQKRGKQLSPVPVANTPLLPGDMRALIEARGADAVPMIAGYATHEGVSLEMMVKLSTGLPQIAINIVSFIAARAIAMHGALGKAGVKGYLQRLKRATGTRGFGARFSDVVWTDGFRRGAHEYLMATARAGSRGWLYVMDIPMRLAGRSIPSSHGVDLALTFDVYDDPEASVPAFADHPNARVLARQWVTMLGHFARHGEPGDALGTWPAFDSRQHASLLVAGDGCQRQYDTDRVFREQVWRAPS